MLHGNTSSPTCFERNDDRNQGTIWSCARSSCQPLQKARLKSKMDQLIQTNFGTMRTYGSCETISNIGELRLPRSTKYASPFGPTIADYVSVARLILFEAFNKYIYIYWRFRNIYIIYINIYIYIYIIYIYIWALFYIYII